jgi:hypothetical protein
VKNSAWKCVTFSFNVLSVHLWSFSNEYTEIVCGRVNDVDMRSVLLVITALLIYVKQKMEVGNFQLV